MSPTPRYTYVASGHADMDDLLGRYSGPFRDGESWRDGLLVSCMRKGIPLEIRDMDNFPEGMKELIEQIAEEGVVVLEDKDNEAVEAQEGFELTYALTPQRDPQAYRSRGRRPAAAKEH